MEYLLFAIFSNRVHLSNDFISTEQENCENTISKIIKAVLSFFSYIAQKCKEVAGFVWLHILHCYQYVESTTPTHTGIYYPDTILAQENDLDEQRNYTNPFLQELFSRYENTPTEDTLFMQRVVDLHRALLREQDACSGNVQGVKKKDDLDNKIHTFENDVIDTLDLTQLLTLSVRGCLYRGKFNFQICPQFLRKGYLDISDLKVKFRRLNEEDQLKFINQVEKDESEIKSFQNPIIAQEIYSAINWLSLSLQQEPNQIELLRNAIKGLHTEGI